MFLSEKDLTDLTGYELGKKQREWLDAHGWVYETDRYGKPKVALEYSRQKMGVQSEKHKRWELDFSRA